MFDTEEKAYVEIVLQFYEVVVQQKDNSPLWHIKNTKVENGFA